MNHFQQLSKDIDEVSKAHPKSLYVRIICRLEYWRRFYWTNETFSFRWVRGEEGEKVGEPIEVTHMTLHDMMEHEAQGVLTERVLLEGLRANAIQHVSFEPLKGWWGKTTIQPRWIDVPTA